MGYKKKSELHDVMSNREGKKKNRVRRMDTNYIQRQTETEGEGFKMFLLLLSSSGNKSRCDEPNGEEKMENEKIET